MSGENMRVKVLIGPECDTLPASFEEWREQNSSPIEFRFERKHIPGEKYDIVVYMYDKTVEPFGNLFPKADFDILVVGRGAGAGISKTRHVAIESNSDVDMHWALDRWSVYRQREMDCCLFKKSRLELDKAKAEIEEKTNENNQSKLQIQTMSEKLKDNEEYVGQINEHVSAIVNLLSMVNRKETKHLPAQSQLSENREESNLEAQQEECRILRCKYEAAFKSITAREQQLKDLETEVKKHNEESTEQLKQEFISAVENTVNELFEKLTVFVGTTDAQTSYPHSGRKKKSPLEKKPELKELCGFLAKRLGDSWRALGRVLDVSTTSLDDIGESYGRFGKAELVWAVLEKWAEKGNPTKEELLQSVKALDQENILGSPMSDQQRDVLQKSFLYILQELMDIELIVPYLKADGILTEPQIEVIYRGRGRYGKADKFLTMLPHLGRRAFEGFVTALERSGQEHIAEKLREDIRDQSSSRNIDVRGELPEETALKGSASCDVSESTTKKQPEVRGREEHAAGKKASSIFSKFRSKVSQLIFHQKAFFYSSSHIFPRPFVFLGKV